MEQCAGCRDVLSAVGVGEEPIVADAVEALGQHVHQEAPDKLVRVKPHGLPAARAVDAIVLPTERDAGVVGCNEAAVRDGDAPTGVLHPHARKAGLFWRAQGSRASINFRLLYQLIKA